MRRFLIAAAIGALALSSAEAPAQQTQRATAISDRDRQTGAEQHKAILEEFGGAYSGPGVALVNRVAKAVAVRSGIAGAGSDCTVTLLNSSVVNAFALPGCYVYVTRGLLAIVNDEAELASVLGHEMGHVAARHSQKRQSRSTLTGLGSVLASVILGSTAGQLANYVGQRSVLAFSRDQEFQADALGIRSMTAAGYDPYAAPDMLQALEADSALQVRLSGQAKADKAPAWARTHPLTSDRIAQAVKVARQTGVEQGTRARNASAYYAGVDGLLWGDDPSEGIVDDSTFSHRALRLRFQAPPGATVTNGSKAVTIVTATGGQAQFAGGPLQRGESLEDYAARVAQAFAGNSGGEFGRAEPTRVNGIDAVVLPGRVQTRSGTMDVDIAAYRWSDGQAFHFIALSPAGRGGQFGGMIASLRRLTEAEAAAIRPRVVQVVTARAGDTPQSLSQRMAFGSLKLERFLAINDREASRPLRPGEQVKLIVYGR